MFCQAKGLSYLVLLTVLRFQFLNIHQILQPFLFFCKLI